MAEIPDREAEMLAPSKVIGFVPTKDAPKARAFYEDQLGFQFVSDDPFALVMRAGQTMIRIAKAQDFQPSALHRPGLGSPRYRGGCPLAPGAGCGL